MHEYMVAGECCYSVRELNFILYAYVYIKYVYTYNIKGGNLKCALHQNEASAACIHFKWIYLRFGNLI